MSESSEAVCLRYGDFSCVRRIHSIVVITSVASSTCLRIRGRKPFLRRGNFGAYYYKEPLVVSRNLKKYVRFRKQRR